MTNKKDNLISERGLTRNTCRLLRGLQATGATVEPRSNFAIRRDRGQPNMNKAAGETAPTWHLEADVGHKFGRIVSYSFVPVIIHHQGRRFEGVQSHLPLTWILKHDPSEWGIARAEVGDAMELLVNDNPPHWT